MKRANFFKQQEPLTHEAAIAEEDLEIFWAAWIEKEYMAR